MEILLTNAEQDPIEIEYDYWDLKDYQDAHRASDFNIRCSRRIPVQRYAHVIAKEGGRVYFRGYVKSPKIKNIDTRELQCMGEEDLLLRRYSGRFAYQTSARRLVHAFQSDPPSQVADSYGVTGNVGLLFIANSMIPLYGNTVLIPAVPDYEWAALNSDWIYKLAGLGTNSRIGTKNIYFEGTLLPRVASYATLEATALSCWSDENDLWVRCDQNMWGLNVSPGFGARAGPSCWQKTHMIPEFEWEILICPTRCLLATCSSTSTGS